MLRGVELGGVKGEDGWFSRLLLAIIFIGVPRPTPLLLPGGRGRRRVAVFLPRGFLGRVGLVGWVWLVASDVGLSVSRGGALVLVGTKWLEEGVTNVVILYIVVCAFFVGVIQ